MAGHGLGPAEDQRRLLAQTAIDPQFDLGIEDVQERIEVAITRRGEERVDDLPLSHDIRVGLRSALHAPSRAAGELLSRRFGTVESRGDVREWHRKDIVQHEGEPLRRRQRVKHDQEREPDGVGKQRLLLGVNAVVQVTTGSGT